MDINEYNSILIVMDQGIGNMIDLTPAIRVMKELKPDLEITVFGRYPALNVIKDTKFVTKVLTEPDGSEYDLGFLAIWWNYTASQHTQKIVASCKEVFQIDYVTTDKPEWWVYLEMARLFGWSGDIAEPFCKTEQPSIVELDPRAVNIAITDTSAESSKQKRWPYYPELASQLIQNNYNVILLGSDVEEKEFQVDKWPNGMVNWLGKLSIPETAYILSHCDYIVGNDCGIAQMGAIFDVPTIMIYGPTYVPKNYPLGKNVKIVRRDLDCAPCQYTERWEKCNDWRCMSQITVENVLIAMQEL